MASRVVPALSDTITRSSPRNLLTSEDLPTFGRPITASRGACSASTAGIVPRELADIEAHITGTVWKIEVAVGDDVDDGDTVVILESMKMEMPVEAEDAGKVAEIRCEEGQSVSEGDVLVVLE